jgi:imidazolonepropionase-like amidohydrolase
VDFAAGGHPRRDGSQSGGGGADEFGTLGAGLSADLLLIDGDATRDVRCLANVRAVYLAGRPVGLA